MSSVVEAADAAAVRHLESDSGGLRLRWADGHESYFHFVWLRDCCYCAECGDSYSSNRYLKPSDVPLDVAPRSAEVVADGALRITWAPDGHESRYALAWLRAHCYAEPARRRRFHRPVTWDASITDVLPAVVFSAAAADERARLDMLRKLRDFGFVVVRDGAPAEEGIEQAAHLIGELSDSAYGRVFDLSPASAVMTLGNTMQPVPPHTDEAYRHNPPGINVLHCVRPAAAGGETVLVDGFHLGETLRRSDPRAFELLAAQPQTFHRVVPGSGIDQRARAPVFVTDEFGTIVGFRFHTRTAAPLDVAADRVPALYAANHALSTMMMDERNQARFVLRAGDAVLFDNHRVMHSRLGFADPGRRLRIANVSRERFHERLRLTARSLGCDEEADQILAAGVSG